MENVEGDLTTFLIYDKFLEKLDRKISPEKCKKVNWLFCYEKIFKNWIKNVNYEDVERRIGFIRNNLSKTLKKVQKRNSQRKNFISEQIKEKFKYEIKKYNFVKSFDNLNEIKNEEKKFEFKKILNINKNKRFSVQIDRKNLNLNKETEFEKYNFNNNNIKNRNLKHKFSFNNFSSSTNFSNNKNSNSLNKEINNFKKNNFNKINLKKFSNDSNDFPKKIILKENNNNFNNNFNNNYNNNLYYIENSNFNKIKLDFSLINKKQIKNKPFFLDEINLLHQLELNDFLNGGIKNYKTEKYFQLFNFHDLFFEPNFEIENDQQILEAKKTCDEIMKIYNSKIYMNSHLLDLEKY